MRKRRIIQHGPRSAALTIELPRAIVLVTTSADGTSRVDVVSDGLRPDEQNAWRLTVNGRDDVSVGVLHEHDPCESVAIEIFQESHKQSATRRRLARDKS